MKKIGKVLIGVALLLLVGMVAFRVYLNHVQKERLNNLEPRVERIESLYGGEVQNISETDFLNADSRLLFDYGIGRIDCEPIGLHTAIVEGSTNALLEVGAGTLKPNQEVGKGNYALAGHNMINRNLLFGSLRYAEVGQVMEVEAYSQKANYEITDISTVAPSAVQLIEDSEGEGLLTLVTCNADGSKRVIIRGTLIE